MKHTDSRGKILTRALVAAGLAVQGLVAGTAANAWDAQPGDFIAAPAGTQMALAYYLGTTSDTFVDGDGNEVAGSGLDTNVGILRYVYFFDLGGMRADINVLQTFGSLDNMSVGGAGNDTIRAGPSDDTVRGEDGNDVLYGDDGFSLGDTTLVGTVWPLNDPENGRYFAIATYLTLPTGEYSATRPGLGSNRWSAAVQPGFVFRFAPQWSVDLAADVTIYGDNDDGPGGVTVEKDPSYTALGWLSFHASDKTTLSLGATTSWGGAETVGGIKGADVESTTVRAAWSQMLNPTTQFLMEVGHDVDAQNTFERDTTLTLRLAKFF